MEEGRTLLRLWRCVPRRRLLWIKLFCCIVVYCIINYLVVFNLDHSSISAITTVNESTVTKIDETSQLISRHARGQQYEQQSNHIGNINLKPVRRKDNDLNFDKDRKTDTSLKVYPHRNSGILNNVSSVSIRDVINKNFGIDSRRSMNMGPNADTGIRQRVIDLSNKDVGQWRPGGMAKGSLHNIRYYVHAEENSTDQPELQGERLREADQLVQEYRLDLDYQTKGGNETPWEMAEKWPIDRHIFPEHAPEMGEVLKAMATWPIEVADVGIGGSTPKMTLTLSGGQKVVFKPKWYSLDRVWKKFDMCAMPDTHNAEIAAFHLARLLGFRRTPLVVGRKVSLKDEVIPVATQGARKTLRNVKDKIFCFDKLCAVGGQLEGAIILWFPHHVTFKQSEHPWGGVCQAMTDRHFQYRIPRVNSSSDICEAAQGWESFKDNPGLFLDLVDAAIMQYLINNADRKLYLGTGVFKNLLPLLDNGKSFGDPSRDVIEILAPLVDCCRVRESTHLRLQRFQNGTLSYVLREVTKSDPLYPLLSYQRLRAIDRRLQTVLQQIELCIKVHGHKSVLSNT